MDAAGNPIASINAATPAGVYKVTYVYQLNGSSEPNMLIESTSLVTITAQPAPEQSDIPETPTNPVQPSTPSSANDNVTPLPESPTASNDNSSKQNVAPKGQDVENENAKGNKTGEDVVSPVKGTSAKTSADAVAVKNAAKKATLPQTGEKQNKFAIIGLAITTVAGLFGLILDRKQRN